MQLQDAGADAPGLTLPPKESGQALNPAAHEKHRDFAGEDKGPQELARLKAAFKRAGLGAHVLSDGSILMTRWGLTRTFPDVCAASRFLTAIGVRQ